MSKEISIEGKIWKPVKCEHCESEFVYKMARTASANCEDIEDETKKASALKNAKVILKERFKHEFDQTPCPNCGKLQSNMLWVHRHNKFQNVEGFAYSFTLFALVLCALGGVLWFVLDPVSEMSSDIIHFVEYAWLNLLLVVPTLLTFALLIRMSRLFINPNHKPKMDDAVKLVNEGTVMDKNQFKAAVKDNDSNNGLMILGASAALGLAAYNLLGNDSSSTPVEDIAAEDALATSDTPEEDSLADDQVDAIEGEEAIEIASVESVDESMEVAFSDLESKLEDEIDLAMDDIEIEIEGDGSLLEDLVDNA